MATIPGLRPLRLGEILDVAIKLYLRHWRTLIACVVWVVLPVQVLSALVTLSIAPEQLHLTSSGGAGVDPDEVGAFLGAQVVVTVLQVLVFMLATAACFKAVSDAYLGGEPDARRSLGFAVRRLPALLALAVLGWLGLVVALICLVVPAIWLGVSWSLAIPALLFERGSPSGALGRSYRLVKGRWWAVAATMLVGVVLVSFVAGLLEGILLGVPAVLADGNDAVAALANIVAGTIGSVLTTPFTAAVIALLYYDQRVRKEGFDLQLLAAGLGVEQGEEVTSRAVAFVPAEPTAAQRAAAPYWPPPPGWKPPDATEEQPAGAPGQRAEAPQQGAAPPYWPPPPGWQPPEPPPPAAPERSRRLWSSEPPPEPGAAEGDDAEPASRDAEADEPGSADPRGWRPPEAPRWPPDPPARGPGGV